METPYSAFKLCFPLLFIKDKKIYYSSNYLGPGGKEEAEKLIIGGFMADIDKEIITNNTGMLPLIAFGG